MIISVLVIGVNFFFVVVFFQERLPKHWAAYTGVAIIFIAYIGFICFLVSPPLTAVTLAVLDDP